MHVKRRTSPHLVGDLDAISRRLLRVGGLGDILGGFGGIFAVGEDGGDGARDAVRLHLRHVPEICPGNTGDRAGICSRSLRDLAEIMTRSHLRAHGDNLVPCRVELGSHRFSRAQPAEERAEQFAEICRPGHEQARVGWGDRGLDCGEGVGGDGAPLP